MSKEAAYLPKDVIYEILLRASTKDLIQLNRVCKLWSSVISDPKFVYAYLFPLSRPQPNIVIIFKPKSYNQSLYCCFNDIASIELGITIKAKEVLEVLLPDKFKETMFLTHSCRGLVLLESYPSRAEPNALHLCNPLTGQIKRLPPLPRHDRSYFNWCWALVYDVSCKGYKVFGIREKKGLVLTFGTNETASWREFDILTEAKVRQVLPVLDEDEKEVHWLALVWRSGGIFSIFSVDIANEKLTKTQIPSQVTQKSYTIHLTKFKSYLCIINMNRTEEFDIWILEDRIQCEWTKKCSIRLTSLSLLMKNAFYLCYKYRTSFGPITSYSNNPSRNLLLFSNDTGFFFYDLDVKKQELKEIGSLKKEHMSEGVHQLNWK